MAGLTAAEAEKKLSDIQDAEGLRNLINQSICYLLLIYIIKIFK